MRKALLIPFVASALLGCAPADPVGGGSGGAPSTTGGATGTTGGAPGSSGGAPGSSGGAPGNSGGAPGNSGGAPGNTGGSGPGSGGANSGGSGPGSGGAGPGSGGRVNTGGSGPGTGGANTGGAGTGTGGRATGGTNSGGAGTGTGGAAGGSTGMGAAPIDGFEYLLPCGQNQSYSDLVCVNGGACAGNGDQGYLNAGKLNTNVKMKYTGATGMLSVHVQGIVEPKHYVGCTTYFGKPQEGWANGPANGTSGGCYPATSGNYNVYMLQVGANTGGIRYYLNAINQQEQHFSYKIDYTFTMPIKNGDDLWFLAADSNCSAIRNCDNSSTDASGGQGKCNAIQITGLQAAPAITQPYNGQFIVLHATLM